MTRLCVCVSGQIRAIDAPLARLARLLEGRDATVIFSVWDRIGRKLDGALNLDQLWRVLDGDAEVAIPGAWIGHQNFWAALPALRRRLEALTRSPQPALITERIRAVLPQAQIDIEDADLLDLDFPHPIGEDRHSMRLLYKIWRVNKLKRQAERRQGRPFDVVIRMRPDLALEEVDLDRVIREVQAGGFIVGYWGSERAWCSDGFAAGSSAAVDAYSALFARAIAEPFRWQHIHIDLAEHLLALGIVPTPYAETETLMDDERVGVQDLADSLASAQPGDLAPTPAHALTAAAAAASLHLAAQRPDAALAALVAAAGNPALPDRAAADGFLLTLARTLLAADLPVLAAVAALRSGAGEAATRYRRGQTALDAVLAGVTASPSSWRGLELAWDDAAWRQEAERAPAAAALLAEAVAPSTLPLWDATAAQPAPALMLALLQRLVAQGYLELSRSLLVRTLAAQGRTMPAPEALPQALAVGSEFGKLALQLGVPVPASTAEALVKHALEQEADVHALYRLADGLRQAACVAEAAAVQQRAVELDPAHPGARRQWAELLLMQGRLPDAAAQAQQALALHDTAAHRVLAALVAHRQGLRDAAAPAADPARLDATTAERYRTLPGYAEFLAALSADPAPSAPAGAVPAR